MITKSYKDEKGNRIIEYECNNGLFTKIKKIKLRGFRNNDFLNYRKFGLEQK